MDTYILAALHLGLHGRGRDWQHQLFVNGEVKESSGGRDILSFVRDINTLTLHLRTITVSEAQTGTKGEITPNMGGAIARLPLALC